MSAMRSVSWLGLAVLSCGLFGACKSEGDSSTVDGQSNLGGTGGAANFNLDLDETEAGHLGGVAGEAPSPSVAGCESFAGLDRCGVTSVEATFSAANVLLVIDKSSSMDDKPTGFELNKWEALKAALEPALVAVEGELSFGLVLYPFGEQTEIPLDCFEGCCEVPKGAAAVRVGIEPGASSATQVMAALNATSPGGGTPTADALDAALDYFTIGDGKSLEGDRFVLLATDGGPNCGATDTTCNADHCTPNLDGVCPENQGNCCIDDGSYCLDDVAVVQKIQALAAADVQTFVIGIPGTERYADYLNAFATAGGVPNPGSGPDYYAVSAEGGIAELTRTFDDITTHLVRSCEVDLGAQAREKRLINVAVDCNIVPFEDGAGWDIAGDTPTTLVLAGDACKRVEHEGARRIDVVYGCPTVK